ncbi:MAG: sugar transferase [Bacteroidota bacterium]
MSTGSIDYPQRPALRASREEWFQLPTLREGDRRLLLVLSDSLVLVAASLIPLRASGVDSSWLALGWVLSMLTALYAADQYSLEPHSDRVLCRATLFTEILTLLLAWAAAAPVNTYPSLLLSGLLSCLGLLASRRVCGRLLRQASQKVLLVCEGPNAREAYEEVQRHSLSGLEPLGMVTRPDSSTDLPLSLYGDWQELPEVMRSWGIDRVAAGVESINDWHPSRAGELGEVMTLPLLFERLSRRVPVRLVDERWFLEHFHWSRGCVYHLMKRGLDLLFASLGLFLALPLFPWIALLIKLDSPGPIFYSQPRVGLRGRVFPLVKFRTMRADAEKNGAVWAKQNDDRATRVGRFLRKSRLDELPQLCLVLSGKMSLVGPRPERPEFVQQLEQCIPYYSYRHLVPPGVTGWAQVRFPYGASIQDAEEKLKFDLFYLKHRSILFDLLILVRTVSTVLNKQGSR